MGAKSKQIALYMALILICSTYTLIAPFYPIIAKEKGIPLWMIGIVFAVNPFGNMITSIILGRHLISLGRKNVVVASYFFTALSMLLMSPIEYLDKTLVIILSFLSRFIGGVGSSCLFVTVTTIFASDFPDQIQVMIGRMEACIGLGLIIGPMLGTGLYSINLIVAMPCLAAFILVFTPVVWKMLGTFQNYEMVERNISRLSLFLKPVRKT
jgi:MFS family permease